MSMNELLENSVYFGFALTLLVYWIATLIVKRFPMPFWNPLLITTVLVVVLLLVFDIPVQTYQKGTAYLQHFLNLATVCLAVPLYRKLQVLKENLVAIVVSVLIGCITSAGSILLLCKVFALDEVLFVSILPKSITTAMALGVGEKLGAMASITMLCIFVAGLTGALGGPLICKLFRIKDPVAQGLGIGAASHAIGTSRAVEMGEIQGAMSGLTIVVAGVMTVVLAPIAARLW